MLSSCGASGSSSSSSEGDSSSEAPTTAVKVTLPQDSSSPDSGDSSSDGEPQAQSSITPHMWQLTSEDGHTITFIGSMHALGEDCFPLPDRIMNAYKAADTVACEFDLVAFNNDLSKQLVLANGAMYDDSAETIAQHLSAETVDGLTEFFDKMEGKGTMDIYKHYKPWMLASLCENAIITQSGLDIYSGLDQTILQMAHDDGKDIFEVETAEFQFEMLANFSDELYDIQLSGYTADNIDALIKSSNALYEVWKAGDLERTEKFLSDDADASYGSITPEQKKVLDDYNKTMLYDRNKGMADCAEKLLKEKENTFFMVGLAHFIGEGGIIDLLEKKGYKIEVI